MLTVTWVIAGLILGSMPFSYFIGLVFLHKDIRQYGDGAPGATNVARAGNRPLYLLSALLDAFKGTVPVWLAQLLSGVSGWELAAVAIAPVLGHAFTPFLRFRGGMGVATTYGVWLGLLGWAGPVVIGACTGLMFVIQKNWVWSTIGGMLGFLVFLIAMHFLQPAQYQINLFGAWAGHTAIQTARRYGYFKSLPEPQPWLRKLWRKPR